MDHSGIMNDMMSSPDSMAVPKAYDYSTIVADRLVRIAYTYHVINSSSE